MAFREPIYLHRCGLCDHGGENACALCGQRMCDEHVLGDACVDCARDEYIVEAAQQRQLAKIVVVSFTGLPLGVMLASAVGSLSWLLAGIGVGYFAPVGIGLALGVSRHVRRRSRRRALMAAPRKSPLRRLQSHAA